MNHQLVVYEEESRLIWGLIVVAATAAGTYLLGDAFIRESIFKPGLQQFAALGFFALAFWGIFKATEPLYRFKLTIDGSLLEIHVFKGDTKIEMIEHPLHRIAFLMFMPRTPPGENEALIDFTPDYYLVFQLKDDQRYRRLINPGDISFTLKIKDIGKIVRFIRDHNPEIDIDEQQARILGI